MCIYIYIYIEGEREIDRCYNTIRYIICHYIQGVFNCFMHTAEVQRIEPIKRPLHVARIQSGSPGRETRGFPFVRGDFTP